MKKVGQLFRETYVKIITEGIENNKSTFLMNSTHVSGLQMSDLRKDLKKAGANMILSKNSIAKIALKDADYADLAESIANQTAFIWSNEDSIEVSKILVKFAKGSETISIHGGILEGKVLQQADVTKLSELPSREVLLSMLLATIQAPLTRLAGALNAKTRDLLSILKQLSEKKGGS